jgi:hypothetical protein
LINGADDDALTVVPGASPVGSAEPVHVGNKRGRGLYFCWEYLTDDINPQITPQSKCKACNVQFTKQMEIEGVLLAFLMTRISTAIDLE